MKPSTEQVHFWIRTRGQLTEAEEKQKRFDHDMVLAVLKAQGYKKPHFVKDPNNRMILVNQTTNEPLTLNEPLIDEIAQRTELLSGKWLIFISKEYVDVLWEKIKELATQEKIWNAKVSTLAHPWASRGQHVICVYTTNYLDESNCIRVRDALRGIGLNAGSPTSQISTHC